MNALLSRVVGVCALLALLSAGCTGDSNRAAGPTGPSAAIEGQLAAPNQAPRTGLPGSGLESAELEDVDAIDDPGESAAAAAVSFSGNWAGTIKSTAPGQGSNTLKIIVKFTHKGNRLTGTFKLPPDDGVVGVVTFDVTQTKTSGKKRTFTGKLKSVFKGDPCSPSTMPGSLIIDTGKKPMTLTGTFKGKSPGCWIETEVFSLKKS